ncbi:phage head closure protein [uncultured Bacteroides sp.]|uniref:phage head closure protein n=1 Tax=uncultured Bacteroides sp. TaxID=162156 RepID=UPI002AA6A7C7|nr:phage head closure protein [uncultured Bacteroides sp.]
MRAGQLNEHIVFQELITTISETGAQRREYQDVLSIKAKRKKITTAIGDGEEAKEAFIGNTVIFQCRKYPEINEDMRIRWQGRTYGITLLDYQREDNTYIITCSKINK